MKNEKNIFKCARYFCVKFDFTQDELRYARLNGLPYKKSGRTYLYCEQDINDYYSGKGMEKSKRDVQALKRAIQRAAERGDRMAFRGASYFNDKYGITLSTLTQMREDGLPFTLDEKSGYYLYREDDIIDYYAERKKNENRNQTTYN